MRVFVMGRSLPQSGSSYGLFEFEQAKVLNGLSECDVTYVFADMRSVLQNRSLAKTDTIVDGVRCFGTSLPIGGIPWQAFEAVRGRFHVKLLHAAIEEQGMPDVLYVHFPSMCLSGRLLAELERLSIPLVCIEHWSKVQTGALDAGRKEILRCSARQAKKFVCVSEGLRDAVAQTCGIPREDIDVVPNMVCEDVFHCRGECDAPRNNDAGFRFVSVSRLERGKRVDMLVKAFAHAFPHGAQTLVIAGDGSLRREIERDIVKCGIEDRATLVGWKSREEIASLLRSSDCYVSASEFETFGLPFAEAWMCGTPCIAAENNPLKALFSPNNGLLFKTDDIGDLERCLREASETHGFSAAMVTSEWASGLFSSKVVAKRILETLHEACADRAMN